MVEDISDFFLSYHGINFLVVLETPHQQQLGSNEWKMDHPEMVGVEHVLAQTRVHRVGTLVYNSCLCVQLSHH